MLANFLIPIHPEGWRFIAIFAGVTLALAWTPLFWPLFIATGWCVYFFRDPPRLTPARAGLFVAPADGLVLKVEEAVPPRELGLGEQPMMRVSTFLSVFDVHINRIPVDATVDVVAYHPGRFLSAAHETALTNLFSGRAARGIVNRLMRDVGPISGLVPEFPLATAALAPLRAKAEAQGKGDFSPLWCGQNATGCKEIPAAKLTRELAEKL